MHFAITIYYGIILKFFKNRQIINTQSERLEKGKSRIAYNQQKSSV